MFIETVPNRDSPPAVLLRESYRDEQGRSQKRTLANLSKLPVDMIDTLKAVLKGATVVGTGPQELEVERSLPHGHVAAALGIIRKIGLDRLILSASREPASRRCCDLIVAMMVDRLIAPRSKLGFVRAVDEETASSSLGAVLQLGRVKEREAMKRWIGCSNVRRASRIAWRGAISKTACWCSMTSVRLTSRAAAARWRAMATVGITARTGRRSSMDCCARARDCRSPWKCSTATLRTRRP